MRKLEIYRNGELTGVLTEHDRKHYSFRYTDAWYANSTKPPISFTLAKTQQLHESDHLFPFFFNLLSEGVNRALQSRALKIDELDDFGLLSATARTDTIGPVTVKPIP